MTNKVKKTKSLTSNRQPLSRSIRFEVFKRDSFTCNYCGRQAPIVTLHVDHIHPVVEGGTNDILNLITACEECNQGKGKRKLSDNQVITKAISQATLLSEKKEQMEMLFEWYKGLQNIDQQQLNAIDEFWKSLTHRNLYNEEKLAIKKHLKKHGLKKLLDIMQETTTRYLKIDDNGKITEESANDAFNKLGGFLYIESKSKDKPYLKDMHYIRKILRNRLHYVNEYQVMDILEDAILAGISTDDLKHFACTERSWTAFNACLIAYKEELRKEAAQKTTKINQEKKTATTCSFHY